jgi:hypothetical protein
MTTRTYLETEGINGVQGYRRYRNSTGTNDRTRDNPYTATHENEVFTKFVCERVRSVECGFTVPYVVESGFTGFSGGFTIPALAEPDDSKLLQKLQGRTSHADFNLGIFLGEGRESLTTIRNGVKTLSSLYTAIRRYDVKAIKHTLSLTKGQLGEMLDGLSSGWLAWNFGVKPILSDMYAAGETLAALTTSVPYKTSIRANTRVRGTISAGSSGPPCGWQEKGKQVIVHFEENDLTSLSYDLGVHRSQLLGLAWELVPLSFVVDSVVPIGTFLDNRVTQSRFSQAHVVQTTWHKKRATGTYVLPCWRVIERGVHKLSHTSLQRTIHAGLDHLNTVPKLKVPATWFWAATDLSLLWQRFGTDSSSWTKFRPEVFNSPAKRRLIR